MIRFCVRSLPALLLIGLLAAAPAARAEEFRWRDWNTGMREAGASKKPVLVDVYTDWCGWCKRMDRDVYARPDVKEYLARTFVTIKLNAEAGHEARYEGKTYTARTLASRFRVNSYPMTIFLRSGGDHVANVPGYIEHQKFLTLLRYVGDGHLDRGVPFDTFVRQSGGR
jgi:thioredoxin-related protein